MTADDGDAYPFICRRAVLAAGLSGWFSSCVPVFAGSNSRSWLAGDHHVHSRFSGTFVPAEDDGTPAHYDLGTDGIYAISVNARMARKYGLSWLAATDHGGPGQSHRRAEAAYPALIKSRHEVADLVQFYGMELNTPGGDHSSLIMPIFSGERDALLEIEATYDKNEVYPHDPARDDSGRMIDALRVMRGLSEMPLIFANHPLRSVTDTGLYRGHSPTELRSWNDAAPDVAVGMEGAPGHQAAVFIPDPVNRRGRGLYGKMPTYGGFDAMTAKLGGFWDAMLGEGRHWWITANSDSHRNYRDGGKDFWPGEYAKTYVHARKNSADIFDGLRTGRIFVVTGDLISAMDLTVAYDGRHAAIGGTLPVRPGAAVTVSIRICVRNTPNASGKIPRLKRVDLIVGQMSGPAADKGKDFNSSTKVLRRFFEPNWCRDGEWLTIRCDLPMPETGGYIRLRGTNTDEMEPEPDPPDDNPWHDLWFYSNPVFLTVGA
jgi:hypothetical protein